MATPVPPIDPQLPPFPGPNTPESAYDDMAFDWGSAMPGFGNRIAAIGQNAYDNADLSFQMAVDASEYAQAAADRLVDVQTAANGAFAAANYKGEWSTLSGALNVPATVTHLGRLWYLKLNLANVTTQAPALGSTYWGEVSRNDFTVLPCPAGTTIAADRGFYRMSAAGSVLLLPANPFHGMVVGAVNVSGALTPVIQRNGKTICGDAEDYVMNVLNWQIALQFDSASNDWVRINGVTAYTAAQPAIASANTWTALQNFTGGLNLNGIPVVASGSNANGYYLRFADGTQICTHTDSRSFNLAGPADGFFYDSQVWNFPIAFAAAPFSDHKVRISGRIVGTGPSDVTVSASAFFPFSGASVSGSGVARHFAIGKWF
ncbi:hypothetical protein [Comamonas squillarum]|uniref:Tail fiber protein n=1 Tax=Comamonas squillarum TaxID=2977320 RepID=A0ABY5ZX42_9BURK|nr:hypothetical protein [Comamonas sp. PR12]UXC18565.1 hypothetical protein N4T19_00015 [Comamonas sp. PR12]